MKTYIIYYGEEAEVYITDAETLDEAKETFASSETVSPDYDENISSISQIYEASLKLVYEY